MPRATVVIPCYNYARYLQECVDSVLAQTMPDWEAIVIDDASTDETPEVMSRLTDPRIRLVRHEQNLGNIGTYNQGYRMARGEFVVMLSADDRYKPEYLRRTIALFDAHPEVGLVYTPCEQIDDQGRSLGTRPVPHSRDGVYDELRWLMFDNYIPHSAAIARRSVLEDVGLYDPLFPRSGDWELWLRIGVKHPIGFVAEPLYDYRLHQACGTFVPSYPLAVEKEIQEIVPRYLDHELLPPHIRTMRQAILARYYLSCANFRFWRSDVPGGLAAIWQAARLHPLTVLHPRRIAGLARGLVRGLLGRPWWGARVATR
jgi:glycosyltransferase involved in cell wall biosynthesis